MKNFILSILSAAVLFAAGACTAEPEPSAPVEECVITATASLPESRTKMIYEEGSGGVKTGWQTGDTFLALEINGSTVTPVTFTATAPADVKTTFTSSGASAATGTTTWVAVLGKGASFDGETIACKYSAQNGSLKGLESVDYMVATSTGESPDFNYGNGKHLTYLLRIKMPQGVGKIEFNTAEGNHEWTVGKDGEISGCTADYHPKAVKTFPLQEETSEGQTVYLAVPAIDYSDAGLIMTVLSRDGRHSEGKVLSADLSAKGGKVGSFDLSGSPLMDRALPEEAIDFVSKAISTLYYINNTSWGGINDFYDFISRPSWAPFNVGAKASPATAEEAYGKYYAWGETEQKETYTDASYKYRQNEIGYTREYRGRADNAINLRMISGTKYDVARVKWGSAWRMPFIEEWLGLMGNNEPVSTTSGTRYTTESNFITTDVTSWNGVTVSGRTFMRNGITLFLPFCGRYYYTSSEAATTPSMVGKAGYYISGVHNNIAGTEEAWQLYVFKNQFNLTAQGTGYGFSVRPVLAADTDEPAPPVTVTGKVTDTTTGQGIPGVTVSDGYECCKTDASGNYTLQANVRTRTIQITVPGNYEIPMENGRPAFYKRVTLTAATTVDFALTPRSGSGSRFTLITVSDAHVQNASNLTQFRSSLSDIQSTINALEQAGNTGPIVAIALGDQLWDNMAMAGEVSDAYASLTTSAGPLPFMFVIGNHDHETGTGDDDYLATQTYVDHFGPTNYSFEIGNAHFVVIDDIEYKGTDSGGSSGFNKIDYRERISGEIFHWVKQDIANVSDKRNKIAVICTHSPIYNAPGNGENVKSLVYGFNEVHILSGHIHNLTNYSMTGNRAAGGRTLVEHNIQSLCGMWWLGDISPNGTPAGYGIYTFDGGELVSEYNKITGKDKGFQMRVYSGNDSYGGYSWDSQYRGKFLVRIWDGDDPRINNNSDLTWNLTFEYGGSQTQMTRLTESIVDKCAAAKIVKDLGSPYGTGPNAKSYSWWMVDAPGGNPESLSGWKITARHFLPGGWEAIYTENTLTRNYQIL